MNVLRVDKWGSTNMNQDPAGEVYLCRLIYRGRCRIPPRAAPPPLRFYHLISQAISGSGPCPALSLSFTDRSLALSQGNDLACSAPPHPRRSFLPSWPLASFGNPSSESSAHWHTGLLFFGSKNPLYYLLSLFHDVARFKLANSFTIIKLPSKVYYSSRIEEWRQSRTDASSSSSTFSPKRSTENCRRESRQLTTFFI